MSKTLIQQKRSKLQAEIRVATKNLENNFEKFEPSFIIPSTVDIISNIIPTTNIKATNYSSSIHSIAKMLLPNNVIVQSILKGIKLWMDIKRP